MPRLLCVGDIHLGRRPSRLPAELAGEGGRLGPAEAWRRTVAAALDREVDAVLLAGDVVEGSDDRFEAFGHLERGVGRLVEAGVPVIGVAGNHDHLALPLLARRISGFRLLGAGGRWGHELLTGRDGGRVRVHGWSFPRPRVHDNPLEGFEPAPADGVADVGLLHCDLGSTQSPYAPVPAAMLGQTRCDAWLLGHVHKADAMDRSPFGYLGSLCGVDAGEPGPHGPWLAEVKGPGALSMEHLTLAPMRWETVDVPVDSLGSTPDLDAEEVVEEAAHRALDLAWQRAGESALLPDLVAVRLRLTGRRPPTLGIDAVLVSKVGELTSGRDGATLFIEKIEDRSRVALDLAALSSGSDPPALVARALLALEAGEAPASGLLADARAALSLEAERPPWRQLREDGEGPPFDVRALLIDAGYDLLERLLAQGADRGAG